MCAESVAGGTSSQYLRALLKALSETTWNYVAWLTHARNAAQPDAQIALSAVSQTIEAFIVAVNRQRLGVPQRCPGCASYQLRAEPAGGGSWVKVCGACGSETHAERVPPVSYHHPAEREEEGERPAPGGECVEVEDFGIYMSPAQARSVLEQADSRWIAYRGQADWANPFAFFFSEDASLADAHRLAYTSFIRAPAAGAELAYSCEDAACVNPGHAREILLPDEPHWVCGIVDKVTCGAVHLELQVSVPGDGSQRLFLDRAVLDRYGFGDASSFTERVVFFRQPDEQGWAQLLPVERRVDYVQGSAATGWLHPSHAVADDQACPCNSGELYARCHGEPIASGALSDMP